MLCQILQESRIESRSRKGSKQKAMNDPIRLVCLQRGRECQAPRGFGFFLFSLAAGFTVRGHLLSQTNIQFSVPLKNTRQNSVLPMSEFIFSNRLAQPDVSSVRQVNFQPWRNGPFPFFHLYWGKETGEKPENIFCLTHSVFSLTTTAIPTPRRVRSDASTSTKHPSIGSGRSTDAASSTKEARRATVSRTSHTDGA